MSLMMTDVVCRPYEGREDRYQDVALAHLIEAGVVRNPLPWTWISTVCPTRFCLKVPHLRAESPVRINYPPGVCIYCGMPGTTRDHLIPRAWTGDGGQRNYVATVPACPECNGFIGADCGFSVSERRAKAHKRIERRYRGVMRTADYDRHELAEFGLSLRSHIQRAMQEKATTIGRLAWPEDPNYDLRAFQKSGIDDPAALGVL